MDFKLEKTNISISGEKRQHAPYKLIGKCSKCGELIEKDFSDDRYMMHPVMGEEYRYIIYCEECDNEHEINLKFDITLEIVSNKEVVLEEPDLLVTENLNVPESKKGNNMEKCPKCGNMTAQANFYTGQLICYFRQCGYEEPQRITDKGYSSSIKDIGIMYDKLIEVMKELVKDVKEIKQSLKVLEDNRLLDDNFG